MGLTQSCGNAPRPSLSKVLSLRNNDVVLCLSLAAEGMGKGILKQRLLKVKREVGTPTTKMLQLRLEQILRFKADALLLSN